MYICVDSYNQRPIINTYIKYTIKLKGKTMTDLNTQMDYNTEINSIAADLVQRAVSENDNREQAEEEINDYMLHEDIDSHQWIIYTAYALPVIQYSPNDDYLIDNFGNEEASFILANSGLDALHTAIAFWAMYADVQEQLNQAFDDYQENLEN